LICTLISLFVIDCLVFLFFLRLYCDILRHLFTWQVTICRESRFSKLIP
jgi:hypothetical protein